MRPRSRLCDAARPSFIRSLPATARVRPASTVRTLHGIPMLASEPRVHGISVRVNGATPDPPKEPRAKATITWRTGQRDTGPPAEPLVRVICVNKTDPPEPDPQIVNKPQDKPHIVNVKEYGHDKKPQIVNIKEYGQDNSQIVSIKEYGQDKKTHGLNNPPIVNIKEYGQDKKPQIVNIKEYGQDNNTQIVKEYDKDRVEYVSNNKEFGEVQYKEYEKDKISVLVKNEDERSSSGASSAPGSDCERSDSDREADDGTDSGFAPSRAPCARVRVASGPKGGGVKLTIASYSDKDQTNGAHVEQGDGWETQFHMRELDSAATEKKEDSDDVQTKIATAHALLSGSGNGTFSLKNRVRSSIVSLLVQSASNRNYDQEEVGRIVFYTTSMGIVRTTFERCRKVRKILETLMVKFEERDVFMNRAFQQEVRERLGISKVVLPQIFVEGRHLGSAEVVEQLNEIGHLRDLLRPYKKQSVGGVCQQCGGYRYLLCPICGGSKKSVTHRHHFSEDLVALRCVTCDESGLIRCQQCITGEV